MLHIFRLGCNGWHPSSFLFDVPLPGWAAHILLLVKSPAFFRFGGPAAPQTLVEPNTLILLPKNSALFYGARGGDYINDWILFDGDDTLLREWGFLFSSPLKVPEYYQVSELISTLANIHFSKAPYSEQIASRLLSAILDIAAALSKKTVPESLHFPAFLKMRREIYNQPARDWSVQASAKELKLSRAHFQELYKNFFGTTFISDLINSRVSLAKDMLETGNLSVKEICFSCGYSNQVHFSRQFKISTGMTALQYRRQSRLHI